MAHGKGARARSREKRLNAKRAQRAARQGAWDAIRGTSKNKKKKGNHTHGESSVFARVKMFVLEHIGGLAKVEIMVHGGPMCGNIGCRRCSPIWQ